MVLERNALQARSASSGKRLESGLCQCLLSQISNEAELEQGHRISLGGRPSIPQHR